ncbi:DUF417 family protein [Alkaliflexus imshenetskii]|uniref:DUF417 family protein n=1 Tax=Alkaliflexus imshenetskii TaxID=286730 RepID=UPI00047890AA|nr:DUF417 family protein [Alkaliflexus imshenetskii]
MKSTIKKTVAATGHFLFRYALGILLIWIGIMKFRTPEARYIEQALAETFVFKWMMKYVTLYAFTKIIGILQITAGVLIMLKPASKKLSAWGGALATLILLAGVAAYFSSGILWQGNIGSIGFANTLEAFLKSFILLGVAGWCWSDSI